MAKRKARETANRLPKKQKTLDFQESAGDFAALGCDIVLHIISFLRGDKESLINLRNCNRYFHCLMMKHHLVLIWRVYAPNLKTFKQTISQLYNPELLYALDIETCINAVPYLKALPHSLKRLRLRFSEHRAAYNVTFGTGFPTGYLQPQKTKFQAFTSLSQMLGFCYPRQQCRLFTLLSNGIYDNYL